MSENKITNTEVKNSVELAAKILELGLPEFTYKFKPETSKNNKYAPVENLEWTTGFLTGQYWLAYELTGNEAFKEAALIHVDSFEKRIKENINVDHHDMGFLYTLSCVAAWQLTGSVSGKEAAILAADKLMSRFHTKGDFIQAWGEFGAKSNYRLIIDCLMNLPLLYWASEITGDEKYKIIGLKHEETSLNCVVRPDNSTYHTYYFDPETGEKDRGVTAQGYSNDSPWARGQAWGIYGMALSYKYNKGQNALDLFKKITDFYITKVTENCADLIPYWDLIFTDSDNEPKDSSAAVIAACGMLEMAKYLPKEEADYYTDFALKSAKSLYDTYRATPEKSNGLLYHGVYGKSSEFNTVPDNGVDECTSWGDYFWMELLMRLTKPDWKIYW